MKDWCWFFLGLFGFSILSQDVIDSANKELEKAASDTVKIILMLKYSRNLWGVNQSASNQYYVSAKALLDRVELKRLLLLS